MTKVEILISIFLITVLLEQIFLFSLNISNLQKQILKTQYVSIECLLFNDENRISINVLDNK